MSKDFEEDRRFLQADREAFICLGLYALYFLWWYFTAYSLGDGNPESYTYVCGFPTWFFYSCIVGYPIITVVLWIVVRLFFKEMPIDSEDSSVTPNCSVKGDQ